MKIATIRLEENTDVREGHFVYVKGCGDVLKVGKITRIGVDLSRGMMALGFFLGIFSGFLMGFIIILLMHAMYFQ
jgi:hypothetical protein